MTHPEDATAFLKAKLEDRNPKCGNCKWWVRPEPFVIKTFGLCTRYTDGGNFTTNVVSVPDLSLCSAWEKKQ